VILLSLSRAPGLSRRARIVTQHPDCHGVPIQAAVQPQSHFYRLLLRQFPTVHVHTSHVFISVTRVWSAINKHSVTVQGIIPDVAGLNCQVSVCLSHAKSVSSAGAHFTNTHAPRSSYQKDEQFPLQDKSSNKFSEAAYSFVQNWTTASVLPSANSKLSELPALANMMCETDFTALVSGIGAYEWTRDERSELERKSQFCAWCVDIAANRSVYISVDAHICRSADDEEEITRKEDLHDLLTHILRAHSTAL
jgi:hypothetical protein